jgi:hypothetical protein
MQQIFLALHNVFLVLHSVFLVLRHCFSREINKNPGASRIPSLVLTTVTKDGISEDLC